MKVREGAIIERYMWEAWFRSAAQIALDHGIFVEVVYDTGGFGDTTRIYFKVDDHEFENLTELKRAIAMKAFL
jgi:hypothetical protein